MGFTRNGKFCAKNFGNGSLVVGGEFASTRVLQLAFPTCCMNSAEHISALTPHLGVQMTFQQDNTDIHTSREQRLVKSS